MHRLLSRVLAVHAPPKAKASLDILWAGASTMVEACARPGDVNQAVIELGSTVCKVRDPECNACPLRTSCQAYARLDGAMVQEKVSRSRSEIPWSDFTLCCLHFPSDTNAERFRTYH